MGLNRVSTLNSVVNSPESPLVVPMGFWLPPRHKNAIGTTGSSAVSKRNLTRKTLIGRRMTDGTSNQSPHRL